MSYDEKTGDAAIEAAMKEAAMEQATGGEHEDDKLMTMDEARATVARSVAASMQSSLEAFTALPTKDTPNAKQNKAMLVRATVELATTLIAQARKFDRPLILRPERRMKVVR